MTNNDDAVREILRATVSVWPANAPDAFAGRYAKDATGTRTQTARPPPDGFRKLMQDLVRFLQQRSVGFRR